MPRKPKQPRKNKRRRYIRAVFELKDRRFPKRDPELKRCTQAFYYHQPQMLEVPLRRSLELEQSVTIFLLSIALRKGRPVSVGNSDEETDEPRLADHCNFYPIINQQRDVRWMT